MKFHVEHQIFWRYDRPVFIEPMTVRLRPRCDGSLHLLNWLLMIDPEPAGICHSLDLFGNAVSLVWFNDRRDELALKAVSSLETTRDNPFNYLLIGHDLHEFPFPYDDSLRNCLLPFQQRPLEDDRIDNWARDLATASGDAQAFLMSLAGTFSTEFELVNRADGPAHAPAATLEARQGACRDLAVLFIDACRAVGIASRFVSGYAYEPDRDESNELHAWAEVYLPGAGWRGYDPSLGLAVADHHIPVAAAAEPRDAAPTTGTFRGTDAKSMIEYRINIQSFQAQ